MAGRAKYGRGALLIIGFVYSLLGSIFLVLGMALAFLGTYEQTRITGSVFIPLGAVFFLLGVIFLAIEVRKKKRNDRLIENHRFLWGEVVDFVPNTNVRIGGRSPYIVIARYRDSNGRNHIFKSPSLPVYRDPDVIGKPVRIYVSDDSYRHYYVDVEEILPPVIEH